MLSKMMSYRGNVTREVVAANIKVRKIRILANHLRYTSREQVGGKREVDKATTVAKLRGISPVKIL